MSQIPKPRPLNSEEFLPPAHKSHKSLSGAELKEQNDDRERMVCSVGIDVHYELNVVSSETGGFRPRLKVFNPRMCGPACPYPYTGKFVNEMEHSSHSEDPISLGRAIHKKEPYDKTLYAKRDPRLISKTVVVRDYGCKIPIDLADTTKIAEAVLSHFPNQYVAFLGEFVSNMFGSSMRKFLNTRLKGFQRILDTPELLNRVSWSAYASVQGMSAPDTNRWESSDATLTWRKSLDDVLLKVADTGKAMSSQFSPTDVYNIRPCIEQHIETLRMMMNEWCRGFGSDEKHVLCMMYYVNECGRNYNDDLRLINENGAVDFREISLHVPLNLSYDAESEASEAIINPDQDTSVRSSLRSHSRNLNHTETLSIPVGSWSGTSTNMFVHTQEKASMSWGFGHCCNISVRHCVTKKGGNGDQHHFVLCQPHLPYRKTDNDFLHVDEKAGTGVGRMSFTHVEKERWGVSFVGETTGSEIVKSAEGKSARGLRDSLEEDGDYHPYRVSYRGSETPYRSSNFKVVPIKAASGETLDTEIQSGPGRPSETNMVKKSERFKMTRILNCETSKGFHVISSDKEECEYMNPFVGSTACFSSKDAQLVVENRSLGAYNINTLIHQNSFKDLFKKIQTYPSMKDTCSVIEHLARNETWDFQDFIKDMFQRNELTSVELQKGKELFDLILRFDKDHFITNHDNPSSQPLSHFDDSRHQFYSQYININEISDSWVSLASLSGTIPKGYNHDQPKISSLDPIADAKTYIISFCSIISYFLNLDIYKNNELLRETDKFLKDKPTLNKISFKIAVVRFVYQDVRIGQDPPYTPLNDLIKKENEKFGYQDQKSELLDLDENQDHVAYNELLKKFNSEAVEAGNEFNLWEYFKDCMRHLKGLNIKEPKHNPACVWAYVDFKYLQADKPFSLLSSMLYCLMSKKETLDAFCKMPELLFTNNGLRELTKIYNILDDLSVTNYTFLGTSPMSLLKRHYCIAHYFHRGKPKSISVDQFTYCNNLETMKMTIQRLKDSLQKDSLIDYQDVPKEDIVNMYERIAISIQSMTRPYNNHECSKLLQDELIRKYLKPIRRDKLSVSDIQDVLNIHGHKGKIPYRLFLTPRCKTGGLDVFSIFTGLNDRTENRFNECPFVLDTTKNALDEDGTSTFTFPEASNPLEAIKLQLLLMKESLSASLGMYIASAICEGTFLNGPYMRSLVQITGTDIPGGNVLKIGVQESGIGDLPMGLKYKIRSRNPDDLTRWVAAIENLEKPADRNSVWQVVSTEKDKDTLYRQFCDWWDSALSEKIEQQKHENNGVEQKRAIKRLADLVASKLPEFANIGGTLVLQTESGDIVDDVNEIRYEILKAHRNEVVKNYFVFANGSTADRRRLVASLFFRNYEHFKDSTAKYVEELEVDDAYSTELAQIARSQALKDDHHVDLTLLYAASFGDYKRQKKAFLNVLPPNFGSEYEKARTFKSDRTMFGNKVIRSNAIVYTDEQGYPMMYKEGKVINPSIEDMPDAYRLTDIVSKHSINYGRIASARQTYNLLWRI